MSDTDRILKEHEISHKNEAKILAALAEIAAGLSPERRLERIETLLKSVLNKESRIMAIGQDILDAVTAETTSVDSFIALIQGLIDNNTIPAAVGAQILSNINANKAKIDAAIAANTTPPTP